MIDDLLVESSKGIRSLVSEYTIKESATTFIQSLDDTTHTTLSIPTSLPSIRSLAGKAVTNVSILSPSEPAPTGCAVYTVGTVATVFLDVKGRIDIDKEIAKAKDRLSKANDIVAKQKKIMDSEWEAKVSEAVKETEKEKLKAAEVEGRNWEASIQQFSRMKIE